MRFWQKVRWSSFGLFVLAIIFIELNCQKPSPQAKKKETEKTYAEIEEGRLNRMPKKGRRLRRMAYHLVHDGRYEAALEFLREELKGAKDGEKIGTMSDMAWCFRKIGEKDSALNLYHKCQVMAESLNDLVDLSAACADMGQTYCEKGEYKKAGTAF
jgi:tetratricopeptide (TPR) repeat protein